MELQRPRVTPVLPQWDFGIVLEALSKPPYEPLREASFKHLTLKTVFLLATVPLKSLFTDRMDYNLDNTRVNIWIERNYRQDILLYVMGYIGDKLLFESGYYHKHSGCVSRLGEEHCII